MGGRCLCFLFVVGRVGRHDADCTAAFLAEGRELYSVRGFVPVVPASSLVNDGVAVAHDEGIGPVWNVIYPGICPLVVVLSAVQKRAAGHDQGPAAEAVVTRTPAA